MTNDAETAAARGYETLFVPALFGTWCAPVLAKADGAEVSSVLDVACGTGVLARAAADHFPKALRIVGLDPIPGMLAVAAEEAPDLDWVAGQAEDLPFEDASFDRVLCQFGMMFFQDRARALQEFHRVLQPGGRMVAAVWNSVDQNPVYRDVSALIDSQVSKAAADAVRLPFSLGQSDPVVADLAEAGFAEIEVNTESQPGRFPSTASMVEAELRGWLPLFDIHLDEAKIAEVLQASEAALAEYRSETGEAVFTTSAHILTAEKPA